MYKTAGVRGFTIVELLIVIVVIGILAAITIVAFNGIQNRGYDTTVKSDLANVQKQLAMHFVDKNEYPRTFAELTAADMQGKMRATKSAYHTTNNAYIYCYGAGSTYAIVVQSKSGNMYYINGTDGNVKNYTLYVSAIGGQSNACPHATGIEGNVTGVWALQSGVWQSWVAG